MEIKKAIFLTSDVDHKKCPPAILHEYAFIGRSNVGKSSLINMLTANGKLAHTSSSPGKTQTINHYKIDDLWYLVDLPGYGYAKVSKDKRLHFEKFIKTYILERRNLICLFVLVDLRLEPQKIDLEFILWLGNNGVPFSIIFTKADKLSKNEATLNRSRYEKALYESWEELPPLFVTSAETRQGKEAVLDYIDSLNKLPIPEEEPEEKEEKPKKNHNEIIQFTLTTKNVGGKELIYKKIH